MRKNIVLISLWLILSISAGFSATTVFTDDFTTNQNVNWTTSGQIGSSSIYINRSGEDWGGRRNTNGMLELTNDASATTNVAGWVFANTAVSGFGSPYNAILSSNSGIITWSFNMQQIRTDPAGFASGSYGVAFILATTNQTANNTGTGYAVVLGQSGSTDPVRLVKFSAGLSTGLINIITSNTTGMADFGNEYLSILITYDPVTNTWELFLRNDGTTAFTDPLSGSLVSQGTAIDNTYTSTAMSYMGGYWQGSTSANQTAFFDNITVQVESVITAMLEINPTALTGFNYMVTLGPSQPKTFTVNGSNLIADVILNAPADYEISYFAGSNYSSQIILNPIDNTVNNTTIYVRLKAGLALGDYNNENISVTSTGATNQTVSCSGSVTVGIAPDAPLATSATSITPNSFIANWNASANSTSYRLDVLTGTDNITSDLLISEYVEGTSYNKAIEIFNGTGQPVDLAGYSLKKQINGAGDFVNELVLSGILANNDVYVIVSNAGTPNLSAELFVDLATNSQAINFNGNDAVALYHNGIQIDVVGIIDQVALWGAEVTLVRKPTITSPTMTFSMSDWDSYPQDTFSYLGSHTISNTLAYVPGYENLDVLNVTSYPVTGLDELTEYRYVVRAVNTFGSSANSNEITVNTPSGTAPLIFVTGTLNTFATTFETPSAAQNYTLSGANLSANISISFPDGFELSTDGGFNYYTTSTSVPPAFNGTVLVRLTGSVSGTFSGNLVHSSTGAANVNLFVYGTVTGGAIVAPTVQASNIVTYPSVTSISLEWTPGNGSYRVVKINTLNSFTAPADGTSPSASTGYSGFGEQVIYNGATELIDGVPFNGCTVTNLVPNTLYWFRVYEYNGTGLETKYLSSAATNNPRSATTTQTSGSGYYADIYGNGTTLKGLLHTLLKNTHTTQFSYTSTTDQLKYTDEDPSNPNNVIEIYTGWSVNKASYGGSSTDWNKEHTWSKSHGDFGDTAPAGTDIHHLRPCDATVNSTKSNKDFDNGGDAVTDSSPPSGYTGVTGCYDTSNTWEPRPADKGDVARIIMYMAVRYEGTDTPYDLEIVDYVYTDAGTNQPYYGKLATLLQWHVLDPPDAREIQRNNRIAERQGNRNPFIDRPGYAARIWTPVPLFNSNISTTSFTGNWSTPISATDYYLQVATDSLFTSIVSGYENLDINLVNSRVINGLIPGRTYYYRLRSYFLTDYSMYSPYLAVTLALPAVVATSATAISTSGFTANWQGISGITEYQFDLSTSSSFSNFVPGYNALPVTGTSLTIAGLNYNTTYYYRLRAVYGTQNGPNSNIVTATTLNIAIPDVPVNVTISMTESGLIRLDWQYDPTPGTTWNVYASNDPYSGYAQIATGVTTNFKVLDASEAVYAKRFYYVKANR